jgi:chromosome segregation protein
MHLNAIKLSGFKSFVDVTQFDTKTQCVGVVGPNGCGKSNIMDAVRWVLGESRAGELRGESMQDVIFNGSTTRKPSQKASVELIFNNQSGRLQGEWGRYEEVSVKRSLSRDGNSNYYINNQVVRRKDIHDMFMGTGLGPKAYAIIGQGMIAQIIEAKPEEMRVFLEEAAGVSKYKERRKETQARLQDTQENLLRVQDLMLEIGAQIEKLSVQAATAKEFKKQQIGLLEYEYLYCFWYIENEQKKQHNLNADYAKTKTDVEAINTRILNNELEQNNLANNNALFLDQLQQAQQAFSQVNQNIIQLEERKNYQQQQQQTLQQALQEAQQALEQHALILEELQAQKFNLEQELEEICIQQEIEQEQQHTSNIDSVLEQDTRIQQNLLQLKNQQQQGTQQIGLLKQKQQLLLQNIAQKYQRYQKMQIELDSLKKIDGQDIGILQQDLDNQTHELRTLEQKLTTIQNHLQQHQAAHTQALQKVQAETIEMNRLQAHLHAIQDIYVEDNEDIFAQYLAQQNVDNVDYINYQTTKLSSLFKVSSQWEHALASILQHRVKAYCIDLNPQHILQAFELFLHNVHQAENSKATFAFSALSERYPPCIIDADCILNHVEVRNIKITGVMQQWLSMYHTAPNLEYALAHRHKLAVGHYFILENATRIDAFSVTTFHDVAQNSLMNQRKIEDLQQQIKAQTLILEQAQTQMGDSVSIHKHLQQTYEGLQQQIRIQQASTQEQTLALDKLLQQQTFAKTRLESHQQEMYEVQSDMSVEREAHAEIGFDLEEYEEKNLALEEKIIHAESEHQAIKVQIEQHRKLEQQNLLKLQALTFKQQNLKQNLERNSKDTKANTETIAKAKQKIIEWTASIEQLQPHILEQDLNAAMQDKIIKEQALHIAQNTIGEYHQQIQSLQQQAKNLQNELRPLYEKLHQVEMQLQAANISQEQYQQQLNEATEQLKRLCPINEDGIVALPNTDALLNMHSAQSLKQKIQQHKQAIDELGSVNLAAIEELEQTEQRHAYLTEQLNDVTTAIQTLESAIAKIDDETRNLLNITFDSVNNEFGRLFPELFGGGQAKLSLNGDDILYSGVLVMAQPPGKKNATIHLLSGGEKALTAIALVFAIFALNPAPFCLLDEVDAPLDDANTERYAKLIKKMSAHTQFLFISHNKIAMEIAEQLIGVTMQEQGVSRIVSVDMIEAMQNLAK